MSLCAKMSHCFDRNSRNFEGKKNACVSMLTMMIVVLILMILVGVALTVALLVVMLQKRS